MKRVKKLVSFQRSILCNVYGIQFKKIRILKHLIFHIN